MKIKPQQFVFTSADYNSWFDYVRQWERVIDDNPDYPIHVMYFEDMKEVGNKLDFADWFIRQYGRSISLYS